MPIGEYIHYSYENYLKYGINKRQDGPNNISATAAYNAQRGELKKKVSSFGENRGKIKEQLENRLNFFRGGNEKLKGTYSNEEIAKMEQIVEKIISDRLDKYLNGGEINWKDLTVSTENSGLGVGLERGGARWQLENNGRNQIGAVQFRLIQLRSAIENMRTEGMESAETLMTQLTQLEEMYEGVASNLSLESLGVGNGKTKLTVSDIKTEKNGYIHKEYINFNNLTGQNFIGSLNQLWLQFKAQVASFVQGQLGEQYAALAVTVAAQMEKMNEEELLKLFSNTLEQNELGFVRESHGIALQNTITSYFTDKGSAAKTTDGLISASGAKISEKQGKIDLSVNLEELGTFGLSIKNVSNLGHKINIHSGTSILLLMQQYSDFMNHYLNLAAAHGSGNQKANMTMKMKELLKISLLTHGLIGEYTTITGLGNKADIFVVNVGGLYKVYFMNDLINTLIKNPTLGDVEGLETLQLSNKWVDVATDISSQESYGKIKTTSTRIDGRGIYNSYVGAYSRINSLLAELNAVNLRMSINPSILLN